MQQSECGLKERWAVIGRQQDCHSCNCPGPSLDKEAVMRWEPLLADRVLRHLASLEVELRFHPMLWAEAAYHEPLNARDRRVSQKPGHSWCLAVINPKWFAIILLCHACSQETHLPRSGGT